MLESTYLLLVVVGASLSNRLLYGDLAPGARTVTGALALFVWTAVAFASFAVRPLMASETVAMPTMAWVALGAALLSLVPMLDGTLDIIREAV